MNVLLEAYLERNFGDDLFVTLLINRYRNHRFYLLDDRKKGYALVGDSKFGNVCLITEEEAFSDMQKFGAYLLVGGDFYHANGDYHARVRRAKAIHENGGYVLILGASLYKTYPADRLPFVQEFFRFVDVMTLRERTSYAQCEALMPDSCALLSSDMAFTLASEYGKKQERKGIRKLGVSVRRKMDGTEEQFKVYCKTITDVTMAHLNANEDNRVCFLALSTSGFDDRDVIDQIRGLLPHGMNNRIDEIEYSRDVYSFMDEVSTCDALICTRFHSLCLALIQEKPFYPINYEAKVENLLKDIGFGGTSVDYGVYMAPEAVLQALQENRVDEEKYREYVERARHFFDMSDFVLDGECKMSEEYREVLQKLTRRIYEKEKENDRLRESLLQLKEENDRLRESLLQLKEEVTSLNCWLDIAGRSKALQMAHCFIELKHALFGSAVEKSECRRWLRGDRSIIPRVSYIHQCAVRAVELNTHICAMCNLNPDSKPNIEDVPLIVEDRSFLHESYSKYDVIVFSVIDYTFRYQRPQHIADHFVRKGHRVFYINANFNKTGAYRVVQQEGLYQVTLSSTANNAIYSLNRSEECQEVYLQMEQLLDEYGIRDAVMIADYPTWIDCISRIKEMYGFRLVTDYMDDFTGFITTSEEFLKEDCIRLLRLSDAVVASSQFLVDVASQYNDRVFAIRNGTEYAHFNRVFGQSRPKKRKVIGYYGAIAEWFDAGKVEYLARRFRDCDIVLIGAVTNERIRSLHMPNVKKLGEIPYKKLPEYMADFDVCLIPFDTSTDLIKATNPVKFYEYLSAGKKIVATEIPELEPYRNKYVYLANDDKAFGDYVEACLNAEDQLANPEECSAFAKENDWSARVGVFEEVVENLFPRVSIVVLCYNQLDYTRQCVESILKHTAYPNYELILVDNKSTDGTVAYLREMEAKDARIKCVLNETNRGFAGGNNDGIDVSSGDYIILLNNDTLVTRGWITALVKHCSRVNTGIVGAVTNSIGNEAQIKVTYSNVADMPAFAYAYTAKHMNETYPHDGVLAMFCIMFSRTLVSRIGKLDENYGIGMFEDDDYSYAAKQAGFELVLAEDVFIHHFGSVSFKKLQEKTYQKVFENNRAYFEQKWNTTWKMHHGRR